MVLGWGNTVGMRGITAHMLRFVVAYELRYLILCNIRSWPVLEWKCVLLVRWPLGRPLATTRPERGRQADT